MDGEEEEEEERERGKHGETDGLGDTVSGCRRLIVLFSRGYYRVASSYFLYKWKFMQS